MRGQEYSEAWFDEANDCYHMKVKCPSWAVHVLSGVDLSECEKNWLEILEQIQGELLLEDKSNDPVRPA